MISQKILNEFKCSGCGDCCRWPGFVLLTDLDILRMAAAVGISEQEFIDNHTRLSPNRQQLALLDQADGSCAFLQGDACSVYEGRPDQCRTFPYDWSVPAGCPELDKLLAKQKNIEQGLDKP
ncbi:YkgJ family cysteine cluster protein [Pontiellaceae bacterium B1224]|nr:YkgJ family cysteine cluster protein [Pontiellaceae bacterium B1224]